LTTSWWRARLPRAREDGERGSFTFAVVFWALIVMVIAGVVVDGGLAITQRQRAGDIAEQAARAAANDLDQAALRTGKVQISADACDAARNLGADSSPKVTLISCTAPFTTVTGGKAVSAITVTVTIDYKPVLIGMVYEPPGGSFVARASATAYAEAGD
jgi:Flp pilus assembly protein TadG